MHKYVRWQRKGSVATAVSGGAVSRSWTSFYHEDQHVQLSTFNVLTQFRTTCKSRAKENNKINQLTISIWLNIHKRSLCRRLKKHHTHSHTLSLNSTNVGFSQSTSLLNRADKALEVSGMCSFRFSNVGFQRCCNVPSGSHVGGHHSWRQMRNYHICTNPYVYAFRLSGSATYK